MNVEHSFIAAFCKMVSSTRWNRLCVDWQAVCLHPFCGKNSGDKDVQFFFRSKLQIWGTFMCQFTKPFEILQWELCKMTNSWLLWKWITGCEVETLFKTNMPSCFVKEDWPSTEKNEMRFLDLWDMVVSFCSRRALPSDWFLKRGNHSAALLLCANFFFKICNGQKWCITLASGFCHSAASCLAGLTWHGDCFVIEDSKQLHMVKDGIEEEIFENAAAVMATSNVPALSAFILVIGMSTSHWCTKDEISLRFVFLLFHPEPPHCPKATLLIPRVPDSNGLWWRWELQVFVCRVVLSVVFVLGVHRRRHLSSIRQSVMWEWMSVWSRGRWGCQVNDGLPDCQPNNRCTSFEIGDINIVNVLACCKMPLQCVKTKSPSHLCVKTSPEQHSFSW